MGHSDLGAAPAASPARAPGPPGRALVVVGTSLVLGPAGVLVDLTGRGALVLAPDVGDAALRRLLLVVVAWAVVAPFVVDRSARLVPVGAAAVVAGGIATWSTAGRTVGVVALAGAVAAATVVGRPRPGRTGPLGPGAGSGLLLVGLAQLVWLGTASPGPTLALLGAAVAVVEVLRARPDLADATRPAVEAAHGAGRSAVRRVVRLAGPLLGRPGMAAAGLATILTAPIWYRYASQPPWVVGSVDFATHIDQARLSSLVPLRTVAPHPLFHLSTAALTGPLPEPWAVTSVLAVSTFATVLLLDVLGRRPLAGRPGLPPLAAATAAGLFVVVESPIVIAQALHLGDPDDWAPSLHMYLSPTDTLALPLSLALVLVAHRVLTEPPDRRTGVLLALTTVGTLLAKPSVPVVLLVALPVVLVLSGGASASRVRLLAWSFVGPSIAVLAWQAWYTSRGAAPERRSTLVLRPLETLRATGLDDVTPLMFVSLLVVPLCLWAGARRYLAEPLVRLVGCAFVVSLGVLLLLNESDVRAADGNMAKPAFACGVLLHVVSWRFLLGEVVAGRGGRVRAWAVATAVLASLSLVGGVLSWAEAAGLLALPVRGG